ncbi:MAG: hypothetical protein V1859_03160 [archaeon]
MVEDIMKAVKIYKEAELLGKFPPCPSERPYRVGGAVFGPCISEEDMKIYAQMRLQGSTPYEEKVFILKTKALILGNEKNCPAGKPYYHTKFLIFGGNCYTEKEFSQLNNLDIETWEEKEEGKTRFIVSNEYCKDGFLYDTHKHLCVSTSQCDLPHTFFDTNTGNCACDEGYRMVEGEGCLAEQENKECKYDSDCGKSSCNGKNKIMPRCDARTYKCYTETVDCTENFGENAFCDSGTVLCKTER